MNAITARPVGRSVPERRAAAHGSNAPMPATHRDGPEPTALPEGIRNGWLRGSLISALLLFISWQLGAQTNTPVSTHASEPAASAVVDPATAVRAEKLRAACLEGRRCVCGRVLKVLPNGVLVESGYPSLLRDSLHGAWHLPGTVVATRATNLVESLEPDALCIGTVFLTDLPRLRGAKIAPYDYVVLHSYPAGQYTYTSVGGIQHTVRRFAGGLETAVNLILQAERTNTVPAVK